jgi:hypothetical protein
VSNNAIASVFRGKVEKITRSDVGFVEMGVSF